MKNVLVVGSSNIDIHGFSSAALIAEESNEGAVSLSCGGVGRNISEVLSRLGISVKLVSSFGDDYFSKILKENCSDLNIDVSHSVHGTNMNTSSYIAILNNDGNMNIALSDMRLSDTLLTPDFLSQLTCLFEAADIIITDAGLRRDVLLYILSTYSHKPIFHDPASIKKAAHIKGLTSKVHSLKMNVNEASFLSDMVINTNADIMKIGEYFLKEGVKNIFITNGSDGVYYGNMKSGMHHRIAPNTNVVNVTGAGDCFTAGIAYGFMNDFDIHRSVHFASNLVGVNLQNASTISPDINTKNINTYLKGV